MRGKIFFLLMMLLCFIGQFAGSVGFLHAQYTKVSKKQQRADFGIREIQVDRIRRSAESGTLSAVEAGRAVSHWYRITTVYSSRPEWSDGVVVKYYVLLEEKGQGEGNTMLVDEVEYDSIPKDSAHNAHIFVHPRTVERYGKPQKVMVEIWHQGVRAAQEWWPNKSEEEWWVQHRPIQGSMKIKFFTPFVLDKNLEEENINIKSFFE
ncbi:hypothetical protein KDK77_10020 [bacterium]|nr:hypothetical protein [bacterium]MCP5463178.1 hypothetical protein [bacterium]